jgi:hypothetical protein
MSAAPWGSGSQARAAMPSAARSRHRGAPPPPAPPLADRHCSTGLIRSATASTGHRRVGRRRRRHQFHDQRHSRRRQTARMASGTSLSAWARRRGCLKASSRRPSGAKARADTRGQASVRSSNTGRRGPALATLAVLGRSSWYRGCRDPGCCSWRRRRRVVHGRIHTRPVTTRSG